MSMTKEEKNKSAKERRNWLKSKGICIQCGQENAISGYVRCGDCLYKQMQYRDKYRNTHDTKKHDSEIVKQRKQKLKEQGLCIQCGKHKIYRNSKCIECWTKEQKRRPKYYQKTNAREMWRKQGLCTKCGDIRVEGYKVCQRCLDNIRKAQKLSPLNELWQEDNSLIFMKKAGA